MNITSELFDASLKCPTKCFLRSRGEAGAGNAYADWVRSQTDSYRSEQIRELTATAARDGRIMTTPLTETRRRPTGDILLILWRGLKTFSLISTSWNGLFRTNSADRFSSSQSDSSTPIKSTQTTRYCWHSMRSCYPTCSDAR